MNRRYARGTTAVRNDRRYNSGSTAYPFTLSSQRLVRSPQSLQFLSASLSLARAPLKPATQIHTFRRRFVVSSLILASLGFNSSNPQGKTPVDSRFTTVWSPRVGLGFIENVVNFWCSSWAKENFRCLVMYAHLIHALTPRIFIKNSKI